MITWLIKIKFASDLSLEHKCIKRGKHKEGLYHIQHINNALHSNLNKWMDKFNGVATKYVSNYIKLLQLSNNDKEIIMAKNFKHKVM